jgi:hypothetical protein
MQALLQLQGICGVPVTLGQDLSKYFSFPLSFVLPLILHTLFFHLLQLVQYACQWLQYQGIQSHLTHMITKSNSFPK